MKPATLRHWSGLCAVAMTAVLVAACGPRAGAEPTIELVIAYGSEKENWLADVTKTFNDANHSVNGKRVRVTAKPMGSGECVNDVIDGKVQAHLVSPASGLWIKLGNERCKALKAPDLLDENATKSVVTSPVVIAMWEPMAKTLGWPRKEIGWREILDLAKDKDGWAKHGHPEWGKFKLGHTHPEYSNSGLISVLAMTGAAAGKTRGLTVADVKAAAVGTFMEEIQQSVVQYGQSTGFFGKRMVTGGPSQLSAAVLYENMVIESYLDPKNKPEMKMVAIYPKEGCFWSDHPVGIVQRPWVGADEKAAAQMYVEFLTAKPQQEKAAAYGFRPGDESIEVDQKGGKFSEEFGVRASPPKDQAVPSAEVVTAVVDLWKEKKKPVRVVLVLDVSGSMRLEGRLANAKDGAVQLCGLLGERDELSLLTFSSRVNGPVQPPVRMKADGKKNACDRVEGLIASGETALYDAIDAAYQYAKANPRPDVITAVVVLTDGEDNKSTLSVQTLKPRIQFDPEVTSTRVFTIAYGKDANRKILDEIASFTQAKSYAGTPDNIKKVFRDIFIDF